MKVYYEKEEWWPVYVFEHEVEPTWCIQGDVPEDLVKRYMEAQKEFRKVLEEVKIALGHQD